MALVKCFKCPCNPDHDYGTQTAFTKHKTSKRHIAMVDQQDITHIRAEAKKLENINAVLIKKLDKAASYEDQLQEEAVILEEKYDLLATLYDDLQQEVALLKAELEKMKVVEAKKKPLQKKPIKMINIGIQAEEGIYVN